jgi:putative hydrolase of the HAD superfamily
MRYHGRVPDALPIAILFDLDDTLLSYGEAGEVAGQAVCARLAPHVPGADARTLREAIGEYSAWYWSDPERHRVGRLDLPAARQHIIHTVLRTYHMDHPALAAEMADLREQVHEAELRLYPGAIDTLQRLRARGVRLGMITNGAEAPQRRKLDRFALWPYFPSVLIEGAFGVGKPDPRVFLHVLHELHVAPADAWMVGDSLSLDIAGAHAVGLTTLWHDHRATGLPADTPTRPDRIIHHIAELLP